MAIIRGKVQYKWPYLLYRSAALCSRNAVGVKQLKPAVALLTCCLCMRRETGLRVKPWDTASTVHLKWCAHDTGFLIQRFISHLSKIQLSAVSHRHLLQYSCYCQKIMGKWPVSFVLLNYLVFVRLDRIVWFPFLFQMKSSHIAIIIIIRSEL